MTTQPLLSMESTPDAEVVINGKNYLYFGGTSYYALHGHPQVIKATTQAAKAHGLHSATGVLTCGKTPPLLHLEKTAARFFDTDSAVCFASGYLSNLIGLRALSDRYDRIFVDETSHYSIMDAIAVVGKPAIRFAHRNPEDLQEKIDNHLKEGEVPMVVSDGIFPLFGDIAPADKYHEILEPYQGLLWLDDAHGVGVVGPNGRGTLDYFGIQSNRAFFGGTMGKAFGAHGGIIPGSAELCDQINNTSLVMKGAGSINNPIAAGAAAGMEILMNHPEMRDRLHDNATRFGEGLKKIGVMIPHNPQPVFAWSPGPYEKAAGIQKELMRQGFFIQHAYYPGAGDEGVLRIVIFATHTQRQLQGLLKALEPLL